MVSLGQGRYSVVKASFEMFASIVKPRVTLVWLFCERLHFSLGHSNGCTDLGLVRRRRADKLVQALECIVFSFGRHTKEMGRFQWPFHHHDGHAKVERDVGKRPQDGVRVNAVGSFAARFNQE